MMQHSLHCCRIPMLSSILSHGFLYPPSLSFSSSFRSFSHPFCCSELKVSALRCLPGLRPCFSCWSGASRGRLCRVCCALGAPAVKGFPHLETMEELSSYRRTQQQKSVVSVETEIERERSLNERMSNGELKPVLKQSDPTDGVKYAASEAESILLDSASGESQVQEIEGVYEQTISLKEHPETSGWAVRRQIVEEKEEAPVQVLDGEIELEKWSGLQEKGTDQTEAIAEKSREGLKKSGLFETKLKEPSERQFTESKENVSGSRIGLNRQDPKTSSLSEARAVATETPAVVMAPAKKMVWMPILEELVYRFDITEASRKQASPNISFEHPHLREEAIDVSSHEHKEPAFVPYCNYESGQQVVTFKLPLGTSFYGTGEVGGSLERTGKRIFTWNTDAWGYNQNTTSLYQSHPWIFSVLPSGETFGVLADTTRRCEIDLRKESTIKIAATSSYPVITFGPYPSPEALMTALSHAIGNIQMPPKWALGYQQCRWSYMTADRVSEVAKTFREKKIPCDVIWMDIDYMNEFRCFTFDLKTFPDANALSKSLHDVGFKGIWMLDPGIKCEKGYEAYDSGSAVDAWVQTASGKPYIGECWPGPVVFPDFTRKEVREWWAGLVEKFAGNGVDGIWNDMNEPAVFKTVSKTMPETNIHRGDEELGGRQSHTHYHNVYGMLQARSTYEGMVHANADRRPFVLTRAAYIGSHRYAATWTGDNLANWEHLNMSIPMAMNLGLSGQPFSGPDIGGFAGDATPKLFARWMGIGALLPFARGHSEQGTIDQEPWSFGPEVEELSRLALYRRYRLLPHFYTLFHKSHTTGVPVMTPVFFADPKDPKLRKINDSFMLGSLLVSTCPTPKKRLDISRPVLPQGIWHQFHFKDDHPELPLLYLRGGAILPTGPIIHHVNEASSTDTLTLVVALDNNGRAEGVLYEDAADGFDYKHGQYLLTHYEAKLLPSINEMKYGGEVVVRVSKSEGDWQRPKRTIHVRLLIGDNAEVNGEGMDGGEISLKIPSAAEIVQLVDASHEHEIRALENTQSLLDVVFGEHETLKGAGAVLVPIDLEQGNVLLKLVPWDGGRIISMIHRPSGYEWIEGRLESGGYEEYCGTENGSCTEEFKVVTREMASMEGQEALGLEGDIGGGLVITRDVVIPKGHDNNVNITSKIVARSVGAGSGGFSRLVCLRIHPTFKLIHPLETVIKFTSMDGKSHEIRPNMEFGATWLKGPDRPDGVWVLEDTETGLALVNRFSVEEVDICVIHWGPGAVNLELWSSERPISKETPLVISHSYEMIDNHSYN